MTHPNLEHSYDPTVTDVGIAVGRFVMSVVEMANGNVYVIG